MTAKTSFFAVSLFGLMVACPALAATTATQDWVKNNYYSKTAVNTLNNNFIRVRDSVLLYDADPNSPTRGQILNSLNTEGQNAFDGINELLTKVDGNDGTSGSAVELETTAKNAYGAINELKDEISGLQDQVDAKVSSDDLNSAVADVVADEVAAQVGDNLDTIYDSGARQRVSVTIVDTEDFDLDDIKPSI